MSELSTEPIIQAYFDQENILAKHQLESFDDYIENILPNILKQYNPIVVELDNESEKDIRIKNIKMHLLTDTIIIEDCLYSENNGVKNILYPDIANRRNYSYTSNILIDIYIEIDILDELNNIIKLPSKILHKIYIGKIPIMVGSKYCMTTKYNKSLKCKYDIGGYFIINGNEKVVISQEKIAPNIVQVFESKKDKFLLNAEIRSMNENVFSIPKCISIKITNNTNNSFKILPHTSNVENYKNEKKTISDIWRKPNIDSLSKEEQEKLIQESGLNTINYKILSRKNIHDIVEIIKVDI